MAWTHYYNPSTQAYDLPLDKDRGQDGQVLWDAVEDWSGSDLGGWKMIHPDDSWMDHYKAGGYIGNGVPKTSFDWQNNDQNDKFDWYVLNVQPPTDGAEDQTFSINVHWNLGVKTGYMDTPLDLVLYEVDLVNNTFQNIEQLDYDRTEVLTLPTPGVAEMKVSADNLEPGEYLVQLADPGWADGGTKEFNYSVDYTLDVWLL